MYSIKFVNQQLGVVWHLHCRTGDPSLLSEYVIESLALAYFCNSLYVRESTPNNLLFIL
jgi:hypothetical protein